MEEDPGGEVEELCRRHGAGRMEKYVFWGEFLFEGVELFLCVLLFFS